MTAHAPSPVRDSLRQLGPVLTAGATFSLSDITGKIALTNGADVLSLLSFRGVIGIGLVYAWMLIEKPAAALSRREKWISFGVGALLTGTMYGLFKAIELVPVSIAVLTYFIYPLLTGILGALTGIDRLTVSGVAAALAAFFGLALIIGANPADLAWAGLAAAVAGALCRAAMLVITRAALKGSDNRLVTWYTLWSSTLLYIGAAVLTADWQPPHNAAGWAAFIAISFAATTGIFALYVSTARIGPFRSALFMNLEPLMTTVLGVLFLGDRLTLLQMLGGATMIAALCVFQMRR